MKLNRYLVVLAVGLFIGYFGKSFFGASEKQQTSKIEEEHEPTITVNHETVKPQTIVAKQPAPIEDQVALAIPAKIETLHFNEVVLTANENNWSDLRNQADAEIEENGWRVHLLKSDTVFEMAGIRDGDLIQKNSLEVARQKSENGKLLADRMTAILDYIAR